MSKSAAASTAPKTERTLLYVLGAVQFIHIMDFMIMLPLGPQLMRAFDIGPGAFGRLVAAYGLAAAVSGFAGGFVLDRFDRKRALLTLFAGCILATLGCALAPTYWTMLAARLLAGTFGGVTGSVVVAMVGDVIPPNRRGHAMSIVMSAFPLSSVLGIPVGLWLANSFGWHAPFMLIVGLGVLAWPLAWQILPHVPSHRSVKSPWRQMQEILAHPVHRRGFALSGTLVFAGAVVVPFMAPALVANVGISEANLPWVYVFGGSTTFFSLSWLGRMSDRHDKLRVLAIASSVAVGSVLVTTHMGPMALVPTILITTVFFVTLSGRFPPAMAMVTNAVDGEYRGGFMSVNAAVQQAAAGAANLTASFIIIEGADGRLEHYERVGYISVACFALTVFLAHLLKRAAPHSSMPDPYIPETDPVVLSE